MPSHYEAGLWVPALTHAFPHLPAPNLGSRREQVEEHVAPLHGLRNRIAHHEPIHALGQIWFKPKHRPEIRYSLSDLHSAALELVGWISPAATAWLADLSQVPAVLAARP